jgi:hypothetical protein
MSFRYFRADGTIGGASDVGNWDSLGVPLYLSESQTVEASLIQKVNQSLPENRPVPKYHPEYLLDTTCRNIIVTQDKTEIWVTFLHEGAGYKNVFGFYTFPLTEPGQTEALSLTDIESTIVFPNCSKKNSGGGLVTGQRVRLGSFSAGTGVGFFLIPDGWNATTRRLKTSLSPTIYTDRKFNSLAQYVQTVILANEDNRSFCLGFEDIMRSAGDQDFNDLVLLITTSTTILQDNILPISNGHTFPTSTLVADRSGLYYQFTEANYQTLLSSETTFVGLKHRIGASSKEKRDFLKSLFEHVHLRNLDGIDTEGDTTLQLDYKIPKSSLTRYQYLLKQLDNDDPDELVDNELETVYRNLVFLEDQYIQATDLTHSVTVHLDQSADKPLWQPTEQTQVVNYLSSTKIWGDPHVKTIDGHVYTLPHEEAIFTVYQSSELDVRASMQRHAPYATHSIPLLRESTFPSELAVKIHDEYIVVDCHTLETIAQSAPPFQHILLSSIDDELFAQLHSVSESERPSALKQLYQPQTRCRYILIKTKEPTPFIIQMLKLSHIEGHLCEFNIISRISQWTKAKGLVMGEQLIRNSKLVDL